MMETVTTTIRAVERSVNARVFDSQDDWDDFMGYSHESRVRSKYVTLYGLSTIGAVKLMEIALESGKPMYVTMSEEE